MTGNIVEKCFAVWNVIQDVFLTLKPNTYCFYLIIWAIFAYPSNKCIIYGPELISKTMYSVIYSYKKEIFRSILFQNTSQRRGIPQKLLDKYSQVLICMSLKQTLSSGQKPVYAVKILILNKQSLVQWFTLDKLLISAG